MSEKNEVSKNTESKKVTNYNEYHLNNDVSYYRQYTTYQWVTGGITVLLLFWNPFIALVFWILTWSLEQKVKVSPIDGSIWFIVPKSEWKAYREQHDIPIYKQYNKNHVAKFDNDITNAKKVKAMEQHNQELQAEYQRAVAPFKNDRALKAGRYYFDPHREEIFMDTTLLDKSYKVYKFADIVSFTPIEEGHNETKKHGITRAVVGGVIAGGAGAVVGAVTGGKDFDYIDRLGVSINFKDGSTIQLMMINSQEKKNGIVAKAAYKNFYNICGILDSQINHNSVSTSNDNRESKNIDIADEIYKFKKLFDDGVITQEEFEAKKKQLLNL